MRRSASTVVPAAVPAASSGLHRGYAMGGLGALALAVAAAAFAKDSTHVAALGQHVALCLSGARAEAVGVWAFAGHCAACWAALGLSAVGAVALIKARTR